MSGPAGTVGWEGTPPVLVFRYDGKRLCDCAIEGGLVRWTLERELETVDPVLWRKLLGVYGWRGGTRIYVCIRGSGVRGGFDL